jgi:AcrR family transcriptional regulator
METKPDRKTQILDTALSILMEHGVKGITIRNIAKRLHLSPMALYRHYPSKEALLQSMIQTASKELGGYLFQSLQEPSPLSRLLACGMQYLHFAWERQTYYTLLFASWNELALDTYSDHPSGSLSSGLTFLMDRIQECQEHHVITDTENPMVVALHFWSVCHGLATLYRGGGGYQQMSKQAYQDMCGVILQRTLQPYLTGEV